MVFPLERDGLGDKHRSVRAEVTLLGDLPDFTTLHLAVHLIGKIDGVSKEDTLKYMEETDGICPYSKAIHGNVEVTILTNLLGTTITLRMVLPLIKS